MMGYKLFNLAEARELIPSLRRMLAKAHEELDERLATVRAANQAYDKAESQVDALGETGNIEQLRAVRAKFQDAIQQLSTAQNSYLSRLNHWVDRITDTGVILRDIHDGLLDFPCEENGFEYLLCWRKDEEDIGFWHLANDGFIGRKPLATLSEYQ